MLIVGLFAAAMQVSAEQIQLDNPLGNINDFPTLIRTVMRAMEGIIAALAILMFLIAGLLFITAGIVPGNYDKAKSALWYGAIGVAVALAAEGLVQVIQEVIRPPQV